MSYRNVSILVVTILLILVGQDEQKVVLSQQPVAPGRQPGVTRVERPMRWDAGLTVGSVETTAIGGRTINSSTKLKVDWRSLTGIAIDHYEVEAAESIGSTTVKLSTGSIATTLSGLKAGTTYAVTVKACYDAACRYSVTSLPASGKTSEEYWQIQGTGNSYNTATRVISDGNIGSHGFRYGEWAGASLNGRIRLYYNPMAGNEKGAKPAITSGVATTSLATVSQLSGESGFGLLNPCPVAAPGQPAPSCPGTGAVKTLALFQAVPMNGFIRMFFEANGTDGKNRILQIDSRDGYQGRDFNRGSRTICQTIGDYAAGGECEARVMIGVEGDQLEGNPGIQHVRQFKMLYPTIGSTVDNRWDGASGTAMILTVNLSSQTCSPYAFLQGYAVWDGTGWRVQYQTNGCPKIFEQMQAPNPVHLGGNRYKLYYNNTTALRSQPSNPLTDFKVMKMIYADGERTGSSTTIDFEDWESTTSAREIFYLWPDGSIMSDENESKFDDHVTILPTRDPSYQVIYSNFSNAQISPFIGMAVLVNP